MNRETILTVAQLVGALLVLTGLYLWTGWPATLIAAGLATAGLSAWLQQHDKPAATPPGGST